MPNKQLWAMQEAELQSYLDAVLNASADQRERAQAAYGSATGAPVMSVSTDGAAVISAEGVLRREPADALTRFLGITVTSYRDLIEAADRAAADDSIKSVRLLINSPGGAVDGLDQSYQHLAALGSVKPLTAEVQGVCASGAYWLACAAERIVSTAPSNPVGSIGVMAVHVSLKGFKDSMGIREIKIISRNAPKKNADPETQTGRDTVQEHIDALERIFHSRVATGRGVSVETVKEKYGAGAMLVSSDPDPEQPSALKAGMIDDVTNSIQTTNSTKGFSAMYKPNESQIQTAAQVLAGASYPKQLKDLAGEVLSGKTDPSALSIAKAVFDSQVGQNNGTTEQTPAWDQGKEDAFNAEVNEARKRMGLAPLKTQKLDETQDVASTADDYNKLVTASRRQMGLS